jgi:hypothetical protein
MKKESDFNTEVQRKAFESNPEGLILKAKVHEIERRGNFHHSKVSHLYSLVDTNAQLPHGV